MMATVQTTRTSSTSAATASRLSRTADDRRQKLRLRDLCDEVLASFRVAKGRDTLSDSELLEARAMLVGMTPRVSRD
jgi:hypothetical protein